MRHLLKYSYRAQSYKPHTLDCSCQFHAELPNMKLIQEWSEFHEKAHQNENNFSIERGGFPEDVPAPVVSEPEPEPAMSAEEEVTNE